MTSMIARIEKDLEEIRGASLWKTERPITTPQSAHVRVAVPGGGQRSLLNLCANNYLGLADHPALIEAAKRALDSHGLGMASVRFICGTSDLHEALEVKIADYVGQEAAILYAACFDANGGVFEPLLGEEDAVISDSLNHASIIDGIRLSKARRFRYANNDMNELEARLREARDAGARDILIVTDGVFSMDGTFADLKTMRALADRYQALLMVDDCHATGFIGAQGRGTAQRAGVAVDIVSGTLGKALGGSAGGFIAAKRPIIDLLRQRSRPYLFSNALPPAVVGAALAAIDLAREGEDRRARLARHARKFREGMTAAGFDLVPGGHPIIPVMLGEARRAQEMATALYEEGVYVTGFFFPVVPKGKARIRTQMSAALAEEDVARAVDAFKRCGRRLGVIG